MLAKKSAEAEKGKDSSSQEKAGLIRGESFEEVLEVGSDSDDDVIVTGQSKASQLKKGDENHSWFLKVLQSMSLSEMSLMELEHSGKMLVL